MPHDQNSPGWSLRLPISALISPVVCAYAVLDSTRGARCDLEAVCGNAMARHWEAVAMGKQKIKPNYRRRVLACRTSITANPLFSIVSARQLRAASMSMPSISSPPGIALSLGWPSTGSWSCAIACCERAAGFCQEVDHRDTAYLDALVRTFEQALKTTGNLTGKQNGFLTRLERVRNIGRQLGSGIGGTWMFCFPSSIYVFTPGVFHGSRKRN